MYNGNIVLLGAPGSGKGTLAKQLSEKYGYTLITTGDILREEKRSGSEIGKKINDILGKGNLVPDDIVNQIIKNKLEKYLPKYRLPGHHQSICDSKY